MQLDEIIKVTPAALDYLKSLVGKKDGALGFYLQVKNSGCSGFRYNPTIIKQEPTEEFISADFSGLKIFVAQDALKMLQGTTIDCKELALRQKQIIYKNPNAEDVCGCGESFNVKDGANG